MFQMVSKKATTFVVNLKHTVTESKRSLVFIFSSPLPVESDNGGDE